MALARHQQNGMGDSAMTLDDTYLALHQAAREHPGGIRALARQLGKREKTLYSKLDPHDEAHEPGLGEFAALVLCLDESARTEVLERFLGIFDYTLGTRVRERAESPVLAVLRSVDEHADVVRAVEQALANDGRIDAAERNRILRECAEARRALQILENTLIRGAEG